MFSRMQTTETVDGTFEMAWMAMIIEHNIADNMGFFGLWDERKVWVPAYFMHNFYPFL
jgi:hypothetical protein